MYEQRGLKMERPKDYIQYYEPRLKELADSLAKKTGGYLLSESAKEKVIQAGEMRVRRCTADYFNDLSARIIKDENPLAQFDLSLLTSEDREKAASVILKGLETGELVLPERLQKTVDVVFSNFENYFIYMLKLMSDHREAVCALLFEGKPYTKITDITFSGDIHNHGKCTTIIKTDAGRFVFKPHSCRIDEKAYEFIGKYFGDVIVMPKVYAVDEEFGICEFLEKRIANGEKGAREYYYSLGGTAAVIKMLGSIDMHMENLFAHGTKLALVDIETLLYPYQEGLGRGKNVGYYDPEDEKALSNSMLRSAFLNMYYVDKNFEKEFSILLSTDEDGSAPETDGQKRTVLDFPEEFIRGFSAIYDRCLERKEELKRDIPEYFSKHILRAVVWATRSYGEVLKRLNSSYSYRSEEYYQSQLDKLPEVLGSGKAVKNDNVTLSEIRHLSEGEIPYFYTYADSRDIYANGSMVAAEYYTLSAIERVSGILDSMGEEEKQFEIRLMRLSLSYTRVKREKESPTRSLRKTQSITKEKALSVAEEILERIYDDSLELKSGERTWFCFDPGTENCSLMNVGLYSGVAGMAVFFAAMTKASVTDAIKRKAEKSLDSAMRMIKRFADGIQLTGTKEDRQIISLGEGNGLGGILKAIVLVNRYTDGAYEDLLKKTKELTCSLDPAAFEDTDKSGGISGLIVTLCRYTELYSDENIQTMIQKLSERLRALKTLKYKDMLLWKTIKPHPISGAVHGMTGIAESLMMADMRLGNTEFTKDAEDALEFEDSCFDAELGCWTDRRTPGTRKPATGNCYGPQGMGIICTHLKNEGIANRLTEHIRKNAGIAIPGSELHRLDHLCCGNMSTVDYYLETGDTDRAGAILEQITEDADQNGEFRLGFAQCRSNNNVTLFYGLAGIGYELLRYTDSEKYTTVL